MSRVSTNGNYQSALLNLMQAQTRVLDLPATHLDARHPKYLALRPIPGAAVAPPSGDT